MMKYLKLAAILLMFFLFSSRSCDEDDAETARREEQELNEELDEVKAHFGADYLTDETRVAFEQNAIQKLMDMADLFRIMADTALDSSFRTKAADMMEALFLTTSTRLVLAMPGEEQGEVTVSELAHKALHGEFPMAELLVDSIMVEEPLNRQGQGIYSGKLGFRQSWKGSGEDQGTGKEYSRRIADITAAKGVKNFGEDQLNVWQVFLGEIK